MHRVCTEDTVIIGALWVLDLSSYLQLGQSVLRCVLVVVRRNIGIRFKTYSQMSLKFIFFFLRYNPQCILRNTDSWVYQWGKGNRNKQIWEAFVYGKLIHLIAAKLTEHSVCCLLPISREERGGYSIKCSTNLFRPSALKGPVIYRTYSVVIEAGNLFFFTAENTEL